MFGNELWYSSFHIGWSVKKFKYVASLYTGNSIKDSEKDNYTDKKNARPYIATKHIEADNNKINYENGLYVKHDDTSFRVAKRGSTLMCIEGGSAGKKKSFLTQDVSFVNKLCCFEPNFRIDSKYLFYYLMSPNYEEDFRTRITGLISGVSVSELLNMSIITPPLSEQQAIADYLDEACSKIDKIIAEAKASIDEYKELKQSVIFEAVTKGLDKNVDKKDSGVEWIGEIPAGWNCEKIRYIVNDIGDIDHYMPESVGHGIAYLMTGDLSDKVSNIDFKKCKQVSYEDYKKLSKKIKAEIGDIIFARYASIGIVCYVDVNKDFLVSYSCVVIKPKHDVVNSLYMKYYLQSKAFKEEVLRLANSNVQMNVGKESLLQAKITVPSLYEQEKIVKYLNKKTTGIDSLIVEKESLINDLEVYKKSLIYEVVTGKRRVV